MMALYTFPDIFSLIIALSATLAASVGVIVLEGFFRNKLKDLFDDTNYFIFFFMVSGYLLYALGEVSYFLARVVFKDTSAIGIQDVYWTTGALVILISFIALSYNLIKDYGSSSKLVLILLIGIGLLGLTLTILSSLVNPKQGYLFSYLYPILSSLIVTASFSIILFYRQLNAMSKPLLIFFLASGSIWIGDIFFHYATASSIYGTTAVLSDTFYLWGYTLSLVAFISLRRRMSQLAAIGR